MLLLALAACGTRPNVPDPDTAAQVDDTPHLTFLAVDNALGKVTRVDTRNVATWTAPLGLGGLRDLALVDEDTVLVSSGEGPVWLSLVDGSVEAALTGFEDVQTARPLPDGHVLLGSAATEDGDVVTFTELDAGGGIVGTPLVLEGYSDLRLARVLDDGNLLFTGGRDGWHVFEVDATGAEVWSAPLPGKGYLAERQADGTTLATTGEDVRVISLAEDGTIARQWGGKDADPVLAEEAFFSGFDAVNADHVLVADWHGHDLTQGGAHAVLYGADGARAWAWEDSDFVQITNVLVLEAVDVEALTP
jgi:hypothetical protein